MAFPTIPTVAASRVLSVLATSPAGTHTSPNLSSLTKNNGDLLIAICITYDGNSTNAEFSNWGAGFLEFGDFAGTATMGVGCAYKISTGAETGTFTVTTADTSTNDSAFFLLSIAGADRFYIPEAGSYATGTAAAADPGSFNPAGWGIEDTLWIAVGGSGEDSTTGSYTGLASAPANYTDYADSGISADVVGGVEGAVAFRQLRAASEDVGTFSVDLSNARNAAAVIAVCPVIEPTYIRRRDNSFPPGRKMPRKTLTEAMVESEHLAQEFQQALDAVVGTAASMVRSVGKIVTASVSTSATMTRSVGKIISATVGTTAAMVRSVGKIVTASVGTTATMLRQVGKILTASVGTTATLQAIKVILLTLNATVGTTATMTRQVGKIVTASVVSTSATMVRQVGKIVTASVATVASLSAIKVIIVTLSATVGTTATITKQIAKTLSSSVATSATMTRQIAKTLTASVVSTTATMTRIKAVSLTLSATVGTVATMTRQVTKTLTASVSTVASITKQIAKTLSAAVGTLASLVADVFTGGAPVFGHFDEPTPTGGSLDEPTPSAGSLDEPTPSSGHFDEPTPS